MPPGNFQTSDIQLAQYRVPAITAYNRLEASPRSADFDRSLKAEIRDPLWMLTRQWQFGEFQGEDAASAATTKILGVHNTMDQIIYPGNKIVSYSGAFPMEPMIESENLKPDLFLAIQTGRYFMRLIRNRPDRNDWVNRLFTLYPLPYQPEANDYDGQQLLTVAQGNIFDGNGLISSIVNNNLPADLSTNLATEIGLFKSWYQRIYNQPAADMSSLWQPASLDYNFSISSSTAAASETELVANHFSGGDLDWYHFDLSETANANTPSTTGQNNLVSYIPSPVSFKGMPNPRFWMMEDSRINFGKIDTSPTGLLHLLLAEFGLISSNDWFMLPYEMPVNTLCEIKGIVVGDVFGQYILVSPAGRAPESEWQRWTMFHHTEMNDSVTQPANRFYLVPATTKSMESDPTERVKFLRDEMANMVWAVEAVVPSQSGKGMSGDEMALPAAENNAGPNGDNTVLRYVLGTTVPANWIPFIPVHIEGSNSEIQLQRAKLPGAKGALGKLLTEKAAPYYINEEIIQRSGVEVRFSFQLARSTNGKRNLWLGRKKQAGSGEGWSNLAFDQTIY